MIWGHGGDLSRALKLKEDQCTTVANIGRTGELGSERKQPCWIKTKIKFALMIVCDVSLKTLRYLHSILQGVLNRGAG